MIKHCFLLGAAFLLLPGLVSAQDFVDPELSGTTQYDGWADLNATNFPGYGVYPGSAAWPTPIGSNQAGSGDGAFNKTYGNGYPPSSGNYVYVTQFGGGTFDPTVVVGSFAVGDLTPVDGVKNVLFQTLMGGALMMGGEYVEFGSGIHPVLNYNGGSQSLVADYYQLIWTGIVTSPQGDGDGFLRGFQWDLSAAVDPITSFEINWSNANHAQIYGMQLDQSDVFGQAIPEPSALMLIALGGGFLMARRRKRNHG